MLRSLPVGALAVWICLACGGVTGTRGAFDNVAACRRYVAAYDALPCVVTDLSAEEYCPDGLDGLECDYAPYYVCMLEGVRCDGSLLDPTGQLDCAVPACP